MARFVDYFMILQVHYFASDDVIKAAYRKLSQKHHPDVSQGKNDFLILKEAYETLINPVKKEAYLKKWMQYHLPNSSMKFEQLNTTVYDATLNEIKKVLMTYLSHIKEGEFSKAYNLLSQSNHDNMFKKDFIIWQKLVSEIHHLLAFDCSMEGFEQDAEGLQVHFRVKVKEYNKLLNRVEEDYFDRYLQMENGKFKVMLNNIDVRNVIRKYKKILALNKKNAKVLHKYLPKIEENHYTRQVSKKYLVNNCEYELLRFKRYKRPFSILAVSVKKLEYMDILESLLFSQTRDIDCFSKYHASMYVMLMPETTYNDGLKVIEKIKHAVDYKVRHGIKFSLISASKEHETVKVMLNSLLSKI